MVCLSESLPLLSILWCHLEVLNNLDSNLLDGANSPKLPWPSLKMQDWIVPFLIAPARLEFDVSHSCELIVPYSNHVLLWSQCWSRSGLKTLLWSLFDLSAVHIVIFINNLVGLDAIYYIKHLLFNVLDDLADELPVDLQLLVLFYEGNNVGTNLKLRLVAIKLAWFILALERLVCGRWAVDFLHVLAELFSPIYLVQSISKEHLDKSIFAFENVLNELMVSTVEIIEDPSMEELQLQDAELYFLESWADLWKVYFYQILFIQL